MCVCVCVCVRACVRACVLIYQPVTVFLQLKRRFLARALMTAFILLEAIGSWFRSVMLQVY